MRNRLKAVVGLGAVMAALTLALALDGGVAAVDGLHYVNRILSLRDATSVRVEVGIDDGELRLGGGSASLMDGEFSYNVDAWRPRVDYAVQDGTGTLRLRQGSDAAFLAPWDQDEVENSWDVRLVGETPIDLEVELGAGTSTLTLGDLDLTGFDLEAGVGATTVDFTGVNSRNLIASVEGGDGPMTLTLPQDVGVEVTVEGRTGNIDAGNLRKDGAVYVNDAYGTAPVTLRITIEPGDGRVALATGPNA